MSIGIFISSFMKFELSEEHLSVQKAARAFAQDVLKPGVIERDTHQKFPAEEIKQLGQLGFLGMMVDPKYGGAGNFASTGGWTISKSSPMDHYSRHSLVVLTEEQQILVEKISRGVFRPCCGNSTHFPDCNHGMAMLGLLELMASQGVSEQDMWKTALIVNSYWFPDTYITLATYMKNKGVDLILEHNAERYPLVAAASIIAKVTGDREIESIKKQIGIDFGSGYMSDPKTVEFLKNNFENYPDLFRKSWFPYQDLVNKKFQKNLSDFSQFLKEEKKHHGHTLEDLKKLEDFGFRFENPKSEHELAIMKGSCTVILYKNGKLLIQGEEEVKKNVMKLLGIEFD